MSDHTTLDALADRYNYFLVDQFGVLLNGPGAYDFAPAALARLAEMGKRTVLLSNSGKRSGPNEARLGQLGFDRATYLNVLSSGEVAHCALSKKIGADISPGAYVLVLSRDDDRSGIEGLNLVSVTDAARADLVLLSGSKGDVMDLSDYETLLRPAAERGAPCLCTNPDRVMLTAQGTCFGAGAIAELYEKLGGQVEWIGKPFAPIYRAAHELLGSPDKSDVICIGDSPAHDIRGGSKAGFATALVRTGIHAERSDDELAALCNKEHAVPDFILPRFEFQP